MKTKEELLGNYRELAEDQVKHKDAVFREVLIDIRDALVARESRLRVMQERAENSTS